jgi:DNA-binding MarR family transcriptional regulator
MAMNVDDQLPQALERLAAFARQEAWRAGEAEGLTPTQADILRLVCARSGGVRPTFAANFVGVSQPTGSDAIGALERKGLLERIADPADGRAILLRSTRAGRALARRWPNPYAEIAAVLGPADREALLGAALRAILKLQQQGAIPAQRMCFTCVHFAAHAYAGSKAPHHCRLLDAPLAMAALRVDCPEHEALAPA